MDVGTLSLGGALSPITRVRRLFTAGEKGVWYDPSDIGTLFQDSAGTTPVTAVTQPVGLMLDKSGNGLHATQVTSTARPTLQIDAQGHYYLKFDGVDDFLATASIDFSASDKVTVFAGVTKALPLQWGMICELSANGTTNNGAFTHIDGGGTTSGERLYASSRGTISTGISTSAIYPGGVSYVFTATHDIVGDSTTLNVNGTNDGSVATDKGTGNFGNYPLYIGMRAGTSMPFGGHLYSLIVRGALSDAAQINATEAYINSRTGAY